MTSPLSPALLAEFRELLEAKREAAMAEIVALKSQLKDAREADNDTAYGSHMADAGSDVAGIDQTYALLGRQQTYVGHLDRALARLDAGTYGVCKMTGKPISVERLRAVPHTETSIEAKRRESR